LTYSINQNIYAEIGFFGFADWMGLPGISAKESVEESGLFWDCKH